MIYVETTFSPGVVLHMDGVWFLNSRLFQKGKSSNKLDMEIENLAQPTMQEVIHDI